MKLRIAVVLMVLAAGCGGGDNQARPKRQATALPFDRQTLTVATPGDVYITRDKIF